MKKLSLGVLLIAAAWFLDGCYYMQAIGGQMEVLRDRQPIDEVIADDETDDALKAKLVLVNDARQYAVDELLLPENDSYSSYRDLGRDYVVWNVFAAPEFSLEPETWCFPVAGCVSYRGYFSEEKARKFADGLKDKGFDVAVGGVAAYSTLGRFEDPILNTMLRWSDSYLVETLFHELAHQKLYVKNDTPFNESFATAVAAIGIERYSAERGMATAADDREELQRLQVELNSLALATVDELKELYESDLENDEMRAQKQELLDALSADAESLVAASSAPARNWLAAPLNNARLVSVSAYEGNVNAFQVLFDNCEKDLACFYERAAELADLDYDARQEALAELTG